MYSISAADAISPAVERTKALLFRPFKWGTFLKLGLVALITEGLGSNLRSSSRGGNGSSSSNGPMIYSLKDIPPQWIAGGVAALLLVIVICAAIYYLITRLRFAFFHCLVTNTREIRPGWELYKEQASRFFWLNIVVGVCFLLLMGLIAIPFVAGFWRVFHDMPPGGHPDFGMLFGLILPLLPIIFLLVVTAIALDIILRDWMLPHIALEDASAGEAWGSVWARIKAEKGQFFAYALLRLILPDDRIDRRLYDFADSGAGAGRCGGGFGVGHSLGICEFDGLGFGCRHHAAGLLRAGGVWIFPAGEHLPGRSTEHGHTRVCAAVLRWALPGAGRLAESRGIAAGVCARRPACGLIVDHVPDKNVRPDQR